MNFYNAKNPLCPSFKNVYFESKDGGIFWFMVVIQVWKPLGELDLFGGNLEFIGSSDS